MSFADEDFKRVNARNLRKRKQAVHFKDDLQVYRAYFERIPSKVSKKKDLEDPLDRHIITKLYYDSYYKSVCVKM